MDASFFSLTFVLAMYAGPTAAPQDRAFLSRLAKEIAMENCQ